jgi:hypothetical protein
MSKKIRKTYFLPEWIVAAAEKALAKEAALKIG